MNRTPLPVRFWAQVQKTANCWLWTGTINDNGYGLIGRGGRGGPNLRAHRVAYELLVGPIPTGLDLDHLCRNRRCVNPAHLEPVTRRVNVLRGTGITAKRAAQTHCIRGHEFTPENTSFTVHGQRQCRACRQLRNHARRSNRSQLEVAS